VTLVGVIAEVEGYVRRDEDELVPLGDPSLTVDSGGWVDGDVVILPPASLERRDVVGDGTLTVLRL
jgi:hypothetical protein